MKLLSTVLIALLAVSAFSQRKGPSEAELESNVAARVASLSKKFRDLLQPTAIEQQWEEACRKDCAQAGPEIREGSAKDGAKRVKAMNAVASQIESEMDAYIARAVRPSDVHPGLLEKRLCKILGNAADDAPPVFVTGGREGQSLIVAYTLWKGGMTGVGGTSVTVRAYAARQGAFLFVAATGEDLDGYAGVAVIKLHSPVPNESWLLVSGHMTGADGPNIRMRLYAYDGARFRTAWAPENAWGTFTIRVTDHGFTIGGNYYKENKTRNDAYFLADDGVYRAHP